MTAGSQEWRQPGAERAGGWLTIDLGAIADNYRTLRDRASGAIAAAVLKADAYGLGLAPVARTLHAAGCGHFFVAHLHEAAVLRAVLGPAPAIYVLNGLFPGTEPDCAALGAIPVLNSMDQLAAWIACAAGRGQPLPAAIQLDTGMSRFGLSEEDRHQLAEAYRVAPERMRWLAPRLLMSHLACAEQPDHPANAQQRAAFERGAALLSPHLEATPRSLVASSGIFLGTAFHHDMIRPGAALFGINPTPGRPNPMRAVIRLQARIVQTRLVPAGAFVGYGATFTARADTRIATVAVGYADGFLRAAGNRGHATLPEQPGVKLPLAGTISMDCLTVDVTALGDLPLPNGTPLDLIGPAVSVDDAATAARTIGYEMLTSLGARYHRVYAGGA